MKSPLPSFGSQRFRTVPGTPPVSVPVLKDGEPELTGGTGELDREPLPASRVLVQFVVEGPPRPKGRPRTFVHGGRVITTTPPETRAYEKLVRRAALSAMGPKSPIQGAAEVVVRAYMPTKRRTDIDNIGKAITDAMNGVVYEDDHQIARLVVERYYDKPQPRVEVEVYELGGAPTEGE